VDGSNLVGILSMRDRAEDVALGQNAWTWGVRIEHNGRADMPFPHRLGCLPERVTWTDGQYHLGHSF
jgi:hypothetical protein